jgi:hypothetical protein
MLIVLAALGVIYDVLDTNNTDLALTGNNGDAAFYKIAGSGMYRPTSCGYPLEAIPVGLDLPPGSVRLTFLHGTNDKEQT